MATTMTPVSIEVLSLPPKDRIRLATLLLGSLEKASGVDEKLLRALSKRAAELRSGKVKGLTTEQAYGSQPQLLTSHA
jgi:putative addiction module component (TIGR02574 family)